MNEPLFTNEGEYVGDIADQVMDDGEFEWHQHLSGQCVDFCRYCTPVEKRALRKPRTAKAPSEQVWIGYEDLPITISKK